MEIKLGDAIAEVTKAVRSYQCNSDEQDYLRECYKALMIFIENAAQKQLEENKASNEETN